MRATSKAKTDALFVKFKANSAFTVSRDVVSHMAEHFNQDATFVTHFALARLRDDIAAGRFNEASAVPVIAERWLSTAQTDSVRQEADRQIKLAGHEWGASSDEMRDALGQM